MSAGRAPSWLVTVVTLLVMIAVVARTHQKRFALREFSNLSLPLLRNGADILKFFC